MNEKLIMDLILKIKFHYSKVSLNSNSDYYKFLQYNSFFLQQSDEQEATGNFVWTYTVSKDFFIHLEKISSLSLEVIEASKNDPKFSDFSTHYKDIFSNLLNNLDELKTLSEDPNNQKVVKNSADFELISGFIKNIQQFVMNYIHNDFILIIDKISDDFLKNEKNKIRKIIVDLNANVLYHGTNLDVMVEILKRGSILGYTTHRYWEKGARYQESDPQYKESFWMKGISMTRDVNYALKWRPFVFVFNKDAILKNYKIQLYNWFHHGARVPEIKKESEEFVVLHKTDKTFLNKDDSQFMKEFNENLEYYNQMEDGPEKEDYKKFMDQLERDKTNLVLSQIREPEGEFFLTDDIFVGILMESDAINFFSNNPNLEFLLNHPKFLGYINTSK